MSQRFLLDTNLLVRHLVQDHPQHAAAAGRIFEACDRGELILIVLPSVLAECLFVLESFYRKPRNQIAQVLSALLNSPGIEIPDTAKHLDALSRYATGKMHFVDCLLAATSASQKLAVATFDADFKRFSDVTVYKPA